MAFKFGLKKENKLSRYSRIQKEKVEAKTWSKNKKGKKGLKGKLKKLIGVSLVFFFLMLIIGSAGGLAVVAHYSSLIPNPEEVFNRKQDQYSVFYDRNGKELYKVTGKEVRENIQSIDDVPEMVKWAFILSEDAEFYDHKGVDIVAIARCAIGNVSRARKCGGSTISQQVLKNTYFEQLQADYEKQGKTLTKEERKIQEIIMSLRMEQQFSKDKILLFYLNEVNFGSNIYGLKTAASRYFGKEVKDLTLEEASILAGIPNYPAKYYPYKATSEVFCKVSMGEEASESEAIKEPDVEGQLPRYKDSSGNEIRKVAPYKCRQYYVLAQFSKHLDKVNAEGEILTTANITAAQTDITKFRSNNIDIKAPHFVFYAEDYLTSGEFLIDGKPLTEEEIRTGGYKVYTTLDLDMQAVAEEELKKWVDGDNGIKKKFGVYNGAMMSINPKTGEILMMQGSKDWFGERESVDEKDPKYKNTARFDPKVNVLITPQQTGSSNKPLSYIAGIEKGMLFTSTFLPDIPVKFGTYEPQNAEGLEMNYEEGNQKNFLRNMLRQSRNRPAVVAADMMGVDMMVEMYQRLGLSSFKTRKDVGISAVLGAVEVKPAEQFNAYAVLANKGKYNPLQPILKILDRDGKVVWEFKPDGGKQVVDERAAYLVTDMLYDYAGDTVKGLKGYPAAAKTGTSDNNKDMYFIGYTPEIVTGIFVGNNNNGPVKKDSTGTWPYGYNASRGAWMAYMNRIMPRYPKTPFTRPAGIVEASVCLISGKLATPTCGGTFTEKFIDGKLPPLDDSFTVKNVCLDLPASRPNAVSKNMLARDIDRANGYAADVPVKYIKLGNKPLHQSFFDKYTNQSSTIKECDTDYNVITTIPTVAISAPTVGQVVPYSASSRTLRIAFSSLPAIGTINQVQVFLGGVAIPLSNNEATQDITVTLDNSYGYGNKTLTISARDTSGRVGSESVGIVLEAAPVVIPAAINITAPTGSISKAAVNTVTVKYTGTATAPATINITFSGPALSGSHTLTLVGDTYTYIIPANTMNNGNLNISVTGAGGLSDTQSVTVGA